MEEARMSSPAALDALNQLRLGLYLPLELVYCTACSMIILKDKIQSHMTFTHKWSAGGIQKYIETIYSGLVAKTSSTLDTSQIYAGPELQFLKPSKKGFHCLDCPLVFLSDTAARTHCKEFLHKKGPASERPLVQCLYKEVGRHMLVYKVIPGAVLHTSDRPAESSDHALNAHIDWVLSCLDKSQIKEDISFNTATVDIKMTPWLHFTRWPALFEGVDLNEALLRIPSLKTALAEFPDLVAALQNILNSAVNVILHLSPEIRLMLRGEEGKSVSKPVRKIGNDTFTRYTTPLIQLVVMLVVGAEYGTLEEWRYDLRYIPHAVYQLSEFLFKSDTGTIDRPSHIEGLCRSVLIHLTETPIVNQFHGSPIAVFMAYLGIEKRKGNCIFREPFGYTSVIAGMLYTVRMLIAEHVIAKLLENYPMPVNNEANHPKVSWAEHLESALISDGKMDLMNKSLLLARNQLLHHNSPSVFRCLVNFLNYGRAHADIPLLPRISWSDNNDTMFFEEKAFRIEAFRTMIREELASLDGMLTGTFAFDGCPEIDQEFLNRTHTGFSSNVPFVAKAKEFASKLTVDTIRAGAGRRFGLCITQRGSPVEQAACFRLTQKSITRYVKLLAFLIHVTAGQPSRGPEILGVKIQGSNGERGNVFNDGGRICIVTTYHKSQSVQDSHRLVLRYLPFSVARHLTIYLLYLRPLVNIQREIEGYNPLPPQLFAVPSAKLPESNQCRLLTTEDLTAQLVSSSELYMGDRLTVSSYRHFAPAMVRKFIDSKHAKYLCLEGKMVDDEDDLDVFEEQAAHTAGTGKLIYAVDTGIGHLTDANVGKWRAASKAWQDFGFQEGFFAQLSAPAIKSKEKKILDSRPPLPVDSLVDGTSHEPSRVLERDMLDYCMRDDSLMALHELTGGFYYKSTRQADSISAVLSGEKIVIVTMETGGGKTLLFFLPLKFKGAGLTIYIAPLLSLTHDMTHRATEAGIPNFLYTELYFNEADAAPGGIKGGTLIIVSQDQVGQEGFKKMVKRMIASSRLDRIVIDEVHITVTELDYRNTLADISWLVACKVQLLMLSGTLPDFVLDGLGAVYGFNPRRDALFMRFPTVRPNISYDIINPLEDGTVSGPTVARLFKFKFFEIDDLDCSVDRGILYCQTARDAKLLATRLGCHAYVGSEKDYESRKEILINWRNGVGAELPQLIVATKALGAGVDVPHVRLVLHWNAPSSLVDYAQESGRAGRSLNGVSKKAWVYLLTKPDGKPNSFGLPYRDVFPFDKRLVDLPSYIAMKDYIQTGGCFRASLHSFLDNLVLSCSSDPTYETCGNCNTRLSELSRKPKTELSFEILEQRRELVIRNSNASLESSRLQREARQTAISRLSTFRDMVVAGQCCVCLYLRDPRSTTHSTVSDCPRVDEESRDRVDAIHQALVSTFYEPKLTCFTCHFTHPVCREWEECDTDPIALMVLFAAISLNHLSLPSTASTEFLAAKYLGVTRTVRGWRTTQLILLVEDLLSEHWFSFQ